MRCIRIVDTTVLCNLLGVPHRNQQEARARDELARALEDGDRLLLPIAAIYETGNHIAHSGTGGERRAAALRFVDMVRQAIEGSLPFTPTPTQAHDAFVRWLDLFPDRAMEGIGLGDLSIIQVWEEQCALNMGRRVVIWSYDHHLAGYDRPPRI